MSHFMLTTNGANTFCVNELAPALTVFPKMSHRYICSPTQKWVGTAEIQSIT